MTESFSIHVTRDTLVHFQGRVHSRVFGVCYDVKISYGWHDRGSEQYLRNLSFKLRLGYRTLICKLKKSCGEKEQGRPHPY